MSSQTLRLPGLWCCGTVILQPGCEDWLTSSRILPPAPIFLGYIVPSIRTEEASAEVGIESSLKFVSSWHTALAWGYYSILPLTLERLVLYVVPIF